MDACHFRVGANTGWGTCLPSVGVMRGTRRQKSGDKGLDRNTKGGIQEHRALMGGAMWDPELRRALPTVVVPSLFPVCPQSLG